MRTFIIITLIIAVIIGIAVAIFYITKHKYESFFWKNSLRIDCINNLNAKYEFYDINDIRLEHRYDIEKVYKGVSPKDYLIYQLQSSSKDVIKQIELANLNKENYDEYMSKVNSIMKTVAFRKKPTGYIISILNRMDLNYCKKLVKNVKVDFYIIVSLSLYDFRTNVSDWKSEVYDSKTILKLIEKLNDDKTLNIVRKVERSFLSYYMRSEIFKRDHNTCRICGKVRKKQEVAYITPISNGGKTVLDNLQTVCKNCYKEIKAKRSNEIEDEEDLFFEKSSNV